MTAEHQTLSTVVRLGNEALGRTDIAQAGLYLLQTAVSMINTDKFAADRAVLSNAQGRLYLYEEQYQLAEEHFHTALVDARRMEQPEEQLAAMVGLMATNRIWNRGDDSSPKYDLESAKYYENQASRLIDADEWDLLKVDYFIQKALLQKAENKNAQASFTIDDVLHGFENLQKTDINVAELRKRIAYAYAIKASTYNIMDANSESLIGYIDKAWEIVNAGVDTKTFVEIALIFADYYSTVNPNQTSIYCKAASDKLETEPISDQVNARLIDLLVKIEIKAMLNLPTN